MAVEVETGLYMNKLTTGVFSHNPLHDIESVWWVGLWFLLCHYEPSKLETKAVQKHVKVVKKFSETLFNNHMNSSSRRQALTGSTLIASTKPQFFAESVMYLIVILNAFRVQLVTYYGSYKPKESQDRTFFIPDVHRKFGDVIEGTMEKLRNDQTELWPLYDIEARITKLNIEK